MGRLVHVGRNWRSVSTFSLSFLTAICTELGPWDVFSLVIQAYEGGQLLPTWYAVGWTVCTNCSTAHAYCRFRLGEAFPNCIYLRSCLRESKSFFFRWYIWSIRCRHSGYLGWCLIVLPVAKIVFNFMMLLCVFFPCSHLQPWADFATDGYTGDRLVDWTIPNIS